MIIITGRYNYKEAGQMLGCREKTIENIALFRKTILYDDKYDLPEIKKWLTDKQLLKVKLFLDKYKNDNRFNFFCKYFNGKCNSEIKKVWDKKIWR